ncbi:MAG TPA: hypothetical protein V6D16_22260 [Candidatus Obscuribacterales bacterium]
MNYAYSSEIIAFIERLNQELDQIERQATEGLTLARVTLERFSNNDTLIQMLAFLNSATLYVDTERRRIQTIVENLSEADITDEEIQEAGEELATKLGRVVETKIRVVKLKNRLENLQ